MVKRPTRRRVSASSLLRSVSLDWLRGFDAAGRRLSFTAAAEELNLTQSAVSKQVALLEETLGVALFVRRGRGLRLTDEGERLFGALSGMLLALESALGNLRPPEREFVSVTVTPAFASLWLAPRLARFRVLEPDIDIRIDAQETRLALEREGIDLAVRMGFADAVEPSWTLLAHERLVLVAGPDLARRIARPRDVAASPFLVFRHVAARTSGLSLDGWHDMLGLEPSPAQPVIQFSQYEPLLRAAVHGLGIAIGRLPLIAPLLATGALVTVLPEYQRRGAGYYLVRSSRALLRPPVQRFATWLAEELARDERSAGALALNLPRPRRRAAAD